MISTEDNVSRRGMEVKTVYDPCRAKKGLRDGVDTRNSAGSNLPPFGFRSDPQPFGMRHLLALLYLYTAAGETSIPLECQPG